METYTFKEGTLFVDEKTLRPYIPQKNNEDKKHIR